MARVKDSSTKENLLDAAISLMLAKGYTATGVEEICQQAGVTKGSFFYYFKSKDDLAKAALNRFWQFQVQTLSQGPFNNLADPLAQALGYLDFFIALAGDPETPKSCLIGNLTQELAYTHPDIRANCEEIFAYHARQFQQMLDEAREKYAPASQLDTKSLAEYFLSVYEGSLILAKARQEPRILEENLRHFKNYLQSLFKEAR
ncbi:MAG: TetR/AcrR family transcriptional regulator [Chloroflexi bacterium]|nr:TetR/AcrR family transcriptional regulator [Chloroflexota bacterium]MCI0580883.1 TetR/AcrR family transcriptional regulator [Chloroflexota bacterium]MCI0649731.1 TetR/AcrR family transcriptional regulator [Chloroflexota bacterium]MCI0725470.1 TetR/AcrR family transcriptional regulator [Chloroflexota bacterium]